LIKRKNKKLSGNLWKDTTAFFFFENWKDTTTIPKKSHNQPKWEPRETTRWRRGRSWTGGRDRREWPRLGGSQKQK
jgi:hypothetical protein